MIIGIDIRAACGQKAGIGTNIYELVLNLGKIDRDNVYLLYSRDNFDAADLLPPNMIIHRFKVPIWLWHPIVAMHARINKITTFLTPSNITVLLLKKKQAVLYIADVSGILFSQFHTIKVTVLSKLYLIAVRRAKAILTISTFSKTEIVRCLKANSDRIYVTKLAVSTDFKVLHDEEKRQWKKALNLPDQFVLFVGSNEPRKNIRGLLSALLKIPKSMRPNLIITGGGGWKNTDILPYINKKGLQKYVRMTGYIERKALVGLYNLTSAFIYPSFYEGFGLPVLEAMSCGAPVICSNTTSLPEVAGEAALKINPENISELASAIERVLNDKKMQEAMGNKGKIQAASFSWQQTAEQTMQIFNELDTKITEYDK